MSPATFTEFALSSKRTPDETYTIEMLIERVRSDFDQDYWDTWSERDDARRAPEYTPGFSKEHVQPAAAKLETLSWVSFQRVHDDERPIRDLSAIRFLPNLSGLVLINNEVSDLTPLGACSELRQLHLQDNPIPDIAPLARCLNIEELSLNETPLADLSVLETLPHLCELSISADQIPTFKRLAELPALRTLEFGLDTFDSFLDFPEMPELRVIRGAQVRSLDGLEKFPKLENLVNLSGDFASLGPLRHSTALTHANILGSRVDSLEPLAELTMLRDLCVSTAAQQLDLAPLMTLPKLRRVNLTCSGQAPSGLEELRDTLLPWDVEFRAPTPRHTPSLELEVVDQNTFKIYDTERPFNLDESDTNKGLLASELQWLDDQIEELLSAEFKEDEDYTIPFQWGGARSRTVVLYSDRTLAAFPRLVLGIQKILSEIKKDWIIYFQSDYVEPEFIVWIYPSKLVVTSDYVDVVRKLIRSL